MGFKDLGKIDGYYRYFNADGTFSHYGYIEGNCGVVTQYSQITKEQYEKYEAMERKDFNKEIADTLPVEVHCGYGYYGATTRYDAEHDIYFVGFRRGSTCD